MRCILYISSFYCYQYGNDAPGFVMGGLGHIFISYKYIC
jgi:hypothetical protein